MGEGLMHPKDRGKTWPRGMQAHLSMKECESRGPLMELLERFSDEQVLRAKAYRGEVPARVRMPYLWPHGLLEGAGPCAQVAVHELLTPVQREREDDDRGYPSCPEEVVCRDVVHNQPERQGSAPGRIQLQDGRVRAGKDPLCHGKIEVPLGKR